jgi:5-methylthioadenosine/S-adenosylhomocysteine deaminase
VRRQYGKTSIRLLADSGLLGPRTCLAHCVWLEPHDVDLQAGSGAHVVHCPSCNLKLGSGIAPVADYLARGVDVALGADGAAANNRLDAWQEMRLAALLAALRGGPGILPALRAFEMATLGGARALGLAHQIGSIEPGKQADLVVLDLHRPHAAGPDDAYTQLVYSAGAADVRAVVVGGRVLVEDRALTTLDAAAALREAEVERARLVARAKLAARAP